jgi:hypothetical protein
MDYQILLHFYNTILVKKMSKIWKIASKIDKIWIVHINPGSSDEK